MKQHTNSSILVPKLQLLGTRRIPFSPFHVGGKTLRVSPDAW